MVEKQASHAGGDCGKNSQWSAFTQRVKGRFVDADDRRGGTAAQTMKKGDEFTAQTGQV